jgi:hypothetical protein
MFCVYSKLRHIMPIIFSKSHNASSVEVMFLNINTLLCSLGYSFQALSFIMRNFDPRYPSTRQSSKSLDRSQSYIN